MFFPDLSLYRYTATSENVVNIGWLTGDVPVSTGRVNPKVRDHLVRMAREPINVMRGLHYCELCEAESPVAAFAGDAPTAPAYLGFGELWVRADNIVYAAPTLIVHYIDAHDYLPPEEFNEAVLRLAAT